MCHLPVLDCFSYFEFACGCRVQSRGQKRFFVQKNLLGSRGEEEYFRSNFCSLSRLDVSGQSG